VNSSYTKLQYWIQELTTVFSDVIKLITFMLIDSCFSRIMLLGTRILKDLVGTFRWHVPLTREYNCNFVITTWILVILSWYLQPLLIFKQSPLFNKFQLLLPSEMACNCALIIWISYSKLTSKTLIFEWVHHSYNTSCGLQPPRLRFCNFLKLNLV
jgi:hypothetical protein